MDAFRSNATQTQFLHLTDLHVDPLYSARAGPGSNCHMRLGRSLFVKNPLPVFGLADSGCDAPVTLIEHTLRVLDTKDVDFILWTGDSSRHDRDNNRRKQRLETYEHNRIAVELYTKYIDVSRAPVIPTIGNWDVFPVSALGCSEGDPQLSNLWSVWEPLFPQGDPITETAKSDFLKGGFFKRPVLDGMVSILSLNTLSFFNENPLVSDCAKFDLRDSIENRPWNPMHVADYQMIWTENLLKEARRDGTRVILQGHVSPMGNAVQLWKQECFEWYVYLAGEYSDVILGHYFGHINRDLVHIVSQRHPLSNHKSKEKKKNKKQIDPLSSSQLKNEPSASSSTYNISSTKPHQINPFRLTTLVPNIIKSFDLKNYKIMAAMFTGSSIVPVYNPGYRIGTLTFQPMPALPPSSNSSSFLRPANFTRAEQAATQSKPPSDSNNGWTVSLTKHTTMYLDIAKANKKAMTEPDMELEYIPELRHNAGLWNA
ncbi:Metallo-dependent phosphatase-like protein [Obelidium mucronatum]|nr:Metallo-dependent phosphatase-like protein [Obelidium mucronatum]